MIFSRWKICLPILILIFTVVFPASAQERGVVVVNKSVLTDSLSQEEVQGIYTGKKSYWTGSFKVRPCMINIKGPLGKHFLESMLGLSSREYSRLWLRATFSGAQPPPPSFRSPEETIDFVNQHEGAIGIIPESAVPKLAGTNCKVVVVENKKEF